MYTEMQTIISARIIAKVAELGDFRAAFDAVLGAGAYEKLAGDVYDTLTGKAA